MKNLKIISAEINVIWIIILMAFTALSSCNDSEFLYEEPIDFYSPDNSYISIENFEASLYNLYAVLREEFYVAQSAFRSPRINISGTDLCGYDQETSGLANSLVPTSNFVYTAYWKPAYRIIYDANVIIGRSESDIVELTDDQKIKVQAEARFFRGYMYKLLADIYGGVPLVLEEVTVPRRDFVRASREETYRQAALDLKFASENLPAITEVDDARISNLVAYHVLAEAYLSLQEWEMSIDAASVVIDDPNMALMTERFGSRANDSMDPDFPWASGGDPYWDLFRKDNQNRSSGNKEALWVIQYAYNVTGGGDGGYRWETASGPRTWLLRVANNDGSLVNLIPYPNTFYGGRGAGQTKPSGYFYKVIWNRSGYDEDLRNADYNIIRDIKVNNPASDHNGKFVIADNVPILLQAQVDTLRDFYPILAKISSMGDHPLDIWQNDQSVKGSISTSGGPANTTFRDEYRIRLAETYLLRAEAYLGANNPGLAANDINEVRARSSAPPVSSSEVDIEYILDERARELYWEENRLQTLMRLGKLVERTNRYNDFLTYYDHQNLWPIPQSEIEKNTEAVLEQNPGY